jgi:hypothetical protein
MQTKNLMSDPCLLTKNQDGYKKTHLIIYVDNGRIFTDKEEIKPIITALSKVFVTNPYICWIQDHQNKEKDTIWSYQPKLI